MKSYLMFQTSFSIVMSRELRLKQSLLCLAKLVRNFAIYSNYMRKPTRVFLFSLLLLSNEVLVRKPRV